MDYIVFDLEWNQCPYGKERENARLPFEIIEIGAVKLNERKEFTDSFRALIRPKVYKRLHFQTKKVIGLTEKDLESGVPFEEAAEAFFAFCGPDARFCTWGTLDLMELQRNLAFYGMEHLLPGPVLYEDVQKLYAIFSGRKKERKSLRDAVEELALPENGEFHLAREDAAYTAAVLARIPDAIIREYYSVDCYQNPKTREEELTIHYPSYEKFVSMEYHSKEELMADRKVTSIRCFTCGRECRRVLRFFTDSSGRNHIGCGKCRDHGYVKSKIRIREASDGAFYAIRTIRHIDEEGLEGLRRRAVYLRLKRKGRSVH